MNTTGKLNDRHTSPKNETAFSRCTDGCCSEDMAILHYFPCYLSALGNCTVKRDRMLLARKANLDSIVVEVFMTHMPLQEIPSPSLPYFLCLLERGRGPLMILFIWKRPDRRLRSVHFLVSPVQAYCK